jgi:hypothetical protein
MRAVLCALLFVTACGGAEFTPDLFDSSREAGTQEAQAALPAPEASTLPDTSPPEGDAGTEASSVLEASPDVSDAAPDVLDAPDTYDGCTPMPELIWIYSGHAIVGPQTFCLTDLNGINQATMPKPCQCVETYTCACLLAHQSLCNHVVSCEDVPDGGPNLRCSQ